MGPVARVERLRCKQTAAARYSLFCFPATLTINRGALQGQPHSSCTLLPGTLVCSLVTPEKQPHQPPGATLGWTQQWLWALPPTLQDPDPS